MQRRRQKQSVRRKIFSNPLPTCLWPLDSPCTKLHRLDDEARCTCAPKDETNVRFGANAIAYRRSPHADVVERSLMIGDERCTRAPAADNSVGSSRSAPNRQPCSQTLNFCAHSSAGCWCRRSTGSGGAAGKCVCTSLDAGRPGHITEL